VATIFQRIAARFIVPAAGTVSDGLRGAFDLEADALLDTASKLHCIAITGLDDDQIAEYGPAQIDAGLAHLARFDYLVGHNILNYDLPLLHKLHGWAPKPECHIVDTLVTSRLILPDLSHIDDEAAARGDPKLGKLRGRYSIEAWGLRLGMPKVGTDIDDWSKWTPEMQARCVGDTLICKRLWQFLQPDGYSPYALELEHRVAPICERITADGAPFDVKAARQKHQEWLARHAELGAQLAKQFSGTNLNSRPQLGALLEKLGWIPEERTKKTKQPKITDEVLETIPALFPEFTGLAEYLILGRRIAQLSTGDEAWMKHVDANGRIHGGLIHIGTPHSRAKHVSPNLAQVPNPKRGKPLAAECRSLFRADNGWVFVCCDQAGLQDRAFAHYLAEFDNGAYAKAYLNGLDPHWKTATDLELITKNTALDKQNRVHAAIREHSKGFRYGFLFGAGQDRAGHIIYNTVRTVHQIDVNNGLRQQFFGANNKRPNETALKRVGKQALEKFIAGTPGLQRLRAKLTARVASHGWLPGLDGRRVPVDAQYKALNFQLSSAEAIITKRWLVNVFDELQQKFKYGWAGDAVITLWIHDEIAACCRPEIADQVGEIMVRHAKEPGNFYHFKVPLDADFTIAPTWGGADSAAESPPIAPEPIVDETEQLAPEPADDDEAETPAAGPDDVDIDAIVIEAPPPGLEDAFADMRAFIAAIATRHFPSPKKSEKPRRGNGHAGNEHFTASNRDKSRSAPNKNRADHARIKKSYLNTAASYKAICPFHDDHDPSLQIYADGHFHCYVCGEHGDIEDLPETIQTPAVTNTPQTNTDTFKRSIELWDAAKSIHGTLAERYLAKTRELDLTILPDIDAVLRFHPRCPFDKAQHPCIIALFRDIETDEIAGIHRIALTDNAEKIERRMLGSWPNSRAIKLCPAGKKLIVGEGIETTIAGGMRASKATGLWAMGSTTAIRHLPLITSVTRLIILVDHDKNNIGRSNARACAARWASTKRLCVLLCPHQVDTDFNDLIRRKP
jgi:DNA polymerase I-like protein with 3'-5' exonuclease and polymerase domains